MRLHVWLAAAAVGLGLSSAVRAEPPEVAPPPRPVVEPTPAERLTAAAAEFRKLERDFDDELQKAGQKMDAVVAANDKHRRQGGEVAKAALALIRRHPAEPVVVDVILAGDRHLYLEVELLDILRKHHFADPRLGKLIYKLAQGDGPQRALAVEIADKHPDRAVRGKATLDIGHLAKRYLVRALASKPSFSGRLGKPDELRERAEVYLGRVLADYADVPTAGGGTLGKLATGELAGLKNIGNLAVGKVGPDIAGEDIDGKAFKLSDYRGKVVLIDFWGDW